MPHRYRHIYSDEAEAVHPLFVLFEETPELIQRGLMAAGLPFVVESLDSGVEEVDEEEFLGRGELGSIGEESFEL
jgi:hypothetical protein